MVPVADKHIKDSISTFLQAILTGVKDMNGGGQRYILDTILSEYDQPAIDEFKKEFCYDNQNNQAHSIDVSYIFPNQKQQMYAGYFVTRGESVANEKAFSLGNIGGSQQVRPDIGNNELEENLVVQKNGNKIFLQTSGQIAALRNIYNLTDNFIESVDGNTITLVSQFSNYLVGQTLTVDYTVQDSGERADYHGYEVKIPQIDTVYVDSVSNNITTVRMLDTILKYIFVLMVNDRTNQIYYQSPTISSQALSVLPDSSSESVSRVYMIRNRISYKVDYTAVIDTNMGVNHILDQIDYKDDGIHEK